MQCSAVELTRACLSIPHPLLSALAKSHHSVLHVDSAGEYGSHLSTLQLSAFRTFLEAHKDGPEVAQEKQHPTEEQLSDWRTIAADSSRTLEYEPVQLRRTFFDASFEDFSEAPPAPAPVVEAPSATVEASEASSTIECESSAPALPAPSRPASVPATLQSESRRFSIDVTPHLLFSRSPLIELLVSAGIHNYVEFKAVDHAYFAHNVASAPASSAAASTIEQPNLQPLPLSKSAIFQTSALSMLDKRLLMKFMHLIMGDDYHQDKEAASKQTSELSELTAKSSSFMAFLKAQKLSPLLIQLVLHSVAQLPHSLQQSSSFASSDSTLSATEGVARLKAYLASVGRYGPGAFLYPNYGVSELPQSFARLCAVHKGIFILRFQPEAIVYEGQGEQRQYRGVITSGGQFVTSDALVSESEYLPASVASSSPFDLISRCTLFLDGALVSTSSSFPLPNSSCFSLSPASAEETPVYGLQLGWEAGVAPRGRVVVHLWTTSRSAEEAQRNKQRLLSFVHSFTRPFTSTTGSQPRLLGLAQYTQHLPVPSSPIVLPPVPQSEAEIAQARERREREQHQEREKGRKRREAQGGTADEPLADDTPAASSAAPSEPSADASAAAEAQDPPAPYAAPLPHSVLRSAAPSASLAYGLDGCIQDAEALLALLLPGRSLTELTRADKTEEEQDKDLELLQQLEGDKTKEKEQEEAQEATAGRTDGAEPAAEPTTMLESNVMTEDGAE